MKGLKHPLGRATKTCVALALALSAALVSSTAFAVSVDAGDYTALPPGANLFLLYGQFTTLDGLYSNGNKVPINAKVDEQVGILRGVHFMDIGGYTVDPQFLLPFGHAAGKDDLSGLGSASGTADLILAATVWLVNKPQSGTYFGITPFLFVPTGTYDHNKPLNLGENRWKYALQGGYITKLADKLDLDLIGDVTLYGNNTNYGPTSATLKQNPEFQFQSFLRYQVTPTWDLRVGASYVGGGETKINGVNQHDAPNKWSAQLGTAVFVSKSMQLLATYGQDTSVENGLKVGNTLELRLLKVF